MKIKYLALALLPLSLLACSKAQNGFDDAIVQIHEIDQENLIGYNWTYQGSNASQPLVVTFGDDKAFSIETGCNNHGGTWDIEDHKILTSELVATMLSCPEGLMAQEYLANDIFSEKKLPFEIHIENHKAHLTITDSKGQKRVFLGNKETS